MPLRPVSCLKPASGTFDVGRWKLRIGTTRCGILLFALAAFFFAPCASAAPPPPRELHSITDTSVRWPTLEELAQVLLLRDYNTRLVVLSTAILASAAGLIGTFLLLRRRSLMGDALSHATLPGIALAFMLMVFLGGTGKNLPGLLAGAAVFGLLGVGAVLLIRSFTRLKDDAAMGIVLSVFFGLGVALLGMVQEIPEGSAAGLESFIYGKTASMIRSDFLLITTASVLVALACALLFKEFAVLCFDDEFAGTQGLPVSLLDAIMLALVAAVTVIGLQAVGLILIIALLIIPPAAARFWTESLRQMMMASVAIGAASGWLGASMSALVPRLPAGAIIIVVSALLFIVSMIFGTSRGVLVRFLQQAKLSRTVAGQHLLRAMYEAKEREAGEHAPDPQRLRGQSISERDIQRARAWTPRHLRRELRRARRAGLVEKGGGGRWRLTEHGLQEAARVVRNHRLWEMYLVTHADIAPSRVDRDADQIEHVLGTEMIRRLERMLEEQTKGEPMPASLHALGEGVSG